MIIEIEKSTAKGNIEVVRSKSYLHRFLIVASLAKGKSLINNITLNEDVEATILALKALGAKIDINNNTIEVEGIKDVKKNIYFDAFSSATTLRLMMPVLTALGVSAKIKMSSQLKKRPLDVYKKIYMENNLTFKEEDNYIYIEGKINPGKFMIPGHISSQFVSGLLLALPLLDGDSNIYLTTPLESYSYVDLTIDVLNKANVKIENKNNSYYVKGKQEYHSFVTTVEIDYSNASYIDVYNYFNGCVNIKDLTFDSIQKDKDYKKYFSALMTDFTTIDIRNNIDLGPILFVFASLKHGGKFIGTKRLMLKESNRVLCMLEELTKFGVNSSINDDDVVIYPSKLHYPKKQLDSHDDHRIAMALCLIMSIYGGKLKKAECVNKSYPTFYQDLSKIGIKIKNIGEENL